MRNSCVIKVSICEKEFFLEREGLRSYFFRLFMFHTGSLISFLLCMRWLGQSWNKHGSLSSVFATALSSISGKNTRFPLPHASLWRQSFPSTTAGEWKMRKGMEIGLQHRQWSLLSYSYDRKKKYIYKKGIQSGAFFNWTLLPCGCPNVPACCKLNWFCSTWISRFQPLLVRECETKWISGLAMRSI